jgi:thioesterase-3
MIVRSKVKIRGYHLDMFRHVNNARYLEFLEEGRWAFFDETGVFDGFPATINFLVVNISINYRQAASLGDILEIRTRISKIGNKSGVMRQEIVMLSDGSPVADADVTFVVVDVRTRKPLNLRDDLKPLLALLAENS